MGHADPGANQFLNGRGHLPESGIRVVFIHQYSCRVAFRIVILAASHCPDKGDKSTKSKDQRARDEYDQNVHCRLQRPALRMTKSELVDIAMAAMSGVAIPATASGTAIAL